jgi:steroid delta-isomerase
MASPEKIREVIEQYVARVATGTTDEVLELYAEGATVQDPVGTEARTTPEAIREFYSGLEGLEQAG